MQNIKLVSVIIPAYNCENSIIETINSVQGQTYGFIEIIIVNDGSTDGTEQIIHRIAKDDKRIKCFSQTNKGVSATRNEGMRHASGEYITFVDADDTLKKDAIQTMMQFSEEADIVISGIKVLMKMPNGKIRESEYNYQDVILPTNGDIWEHFFQLFNDGCLNSSCARLYKRKIIYDNSLCFDTDLEIGEDLQFNLAFLENTVKLKVISGTAYIYHTYRSYLSKKKKEDLFDTRKKSVALFGEHISRHKLDYNIVYYMFLKLIISQAMQEHRNGKSANQRKTIIADLLCREEIQESIAKYRAEGLLGRTIKFVISIKNVLIIDVYAKLCLTMSSWLQHSYKRTSI